MPKKPIIPEAPITLRTLAERKLLERQVGRPAAQPQDPQRLLHELEVHQIELEMQNAELRSARDAAEKVSEKYTDLYDFAPVGYFTLAEDRTILLANLTGSLMVGIERTRLMGRSFAMLVTAEHRPALQDFFTNFMEDPTLHAIDSELTRRGQPPLPVNIKVQCSPNGHECRVVVADITERKTAEAAHDKLEKLSASNLKLSQEIAKRRIVNESMRKTKRDQALMIEQSRMHLQQLRNISHQVLKAQEAERKRVSRELHDVIAQTLVGINMHLAALTHGSLKIPKEFHEKVAHTRELIEKSVEVVHRFSSELRPTSLDDLGLIPALHTHLKQFMEETGIRVSLNVSAGIESSSEAVRTVLYRVAREALTNVAHHAEASEVSVSIASTSRKIRMNVTDNGKGFDLGSVDAGRLGLLGMKERVEMVGGTFHVDSAPGKSTTIRVEIKVNSRKAVGIQQGTA
jgi:PAS domain S-box-containing protein